MLSLCASARISWMAQESVPTGWRNHPIAVTIFRLTVFVMFLAWVMSICALCTYWTGWDGASGGNTDRQSRALLYRLDLKRLTWCSSLPFCDPFFQEGIEITNLNNAQSLVAASNLCFDVFLVFTLFHALCAFRLVLLLCAQQQCCDECCGSCCPILKLNCMKDVHFQIWLRVSCLAYAVLTIASIFAVRNFDSTARNLFSTKINGFTVQKLWYAQATGQTPPNIQGDPNEWAFQDGFNCAVAACVMGVMITCAWLACICLTHGLQGGDTLCGCPKHVDAAGPAFLMGAARAPSAPPATEALPMGEPLGLGMGMGMGMGGNSHPQQYQQYQHMPQAQRVMMAYGLQNNPLQVMSSPAGMYSMPPHADVGSGMAPYYPAPYAHGHAGSPQFHSAGAHRAQPAMYGSPVHSYMAVPGVQQSPQLMGHVAGGGAGPYYAAYGGFPMQGYAGMDLGYAPQQSLPRSGSANSASWPAQPPVDAGARPPMTPPGGGTDVGAGKGT